MSTFNNLAIKFLSVIVLVAPMKCLSQEFRFVPADFKVPDSPVTKHFKLKPLSPKYGKLDYDAVMSSLDHLEGIFGPNPGWPGPEMKLEQSVESIKADHDLFLKRNGFSYSVVNDDESEVPGCVYIFPGKRLRFLSGKPLCP